MTPKVRKMTRRALFGLFTALGLARFLPKQEKMVECQIYTPQKFILEVSDKEFWNAMLKERLRLSDFNYFVFYKNMIQRIHRTDFLKQTMYIEVDGTFKQTVQNELLGI